MDTSIDICEWYPHFPQTTLHNSISPSTWVRIGIHALHKMGMRRHVEEITNQPITSIYVFIPYIPLVFCTDPPSTVRWDLYQILYDINPGFVVCSLPDKSPRRGLVASVQNTYFALFVCQSGNSKEPKDTILRTLRVIIICVDILAYNRGLYVCLVSVRYVRQSVKIKRA